MIKYLLILLLCFSFIESSAQYMKKITQDEYDNFKGTGAEEDWISIVDGKIKLELFRTKVIRFEKEEKIYYFRDYVILIKGAKTLMFRNLHKDFMPMVIDDPYTIQFMENLIIYKKWYNLYINNRPEFAEKVIKFYNLSDEKKKNFLY